MSFSLNKLVQPECGGPNPLVRAAQKIASSAPIAVPMASPGVFANSYLTAGPSRQLDFVKEFADQQQVPRGASSNLAATMAMNQQNLHNLTLQQSHSMAGLTNFSCPTQASSNMMSNNSMFSMTSYPLTNLLIEQAQLQPHQQSTDKNAATQLEEKYRHDMLSAFEDQKTDGKYDDMEFWHGLAQTYMGPTTYNNIAKVRLAEKERSKQDQKKELGLETEAESYDHLDESVTPSAELFEKMVDSSEYLFDEKNPLKDQFDDPFQEGLKRLEEGDIPSAALLFEAAVQKEPDNATAWRYLGTTQAQNEKDKSAIAALTQCLKLDQSDLQAHLSISVSLVNEHKKAEACEHLLLWLRNNARYQSIASDLTEFQQLKVDKYNNYQETETGSDTNNKWDYVRKRFFEAARTSPESPDPDVQTALGLLYSLSSDYDRAIDCFRSALSVRPEDSLIWNRLGATLANNNRNEEAVVAYRRALELAPGFLRSRYNLAVSLVQLNCYEAAAQQLVQILNIQAAGVGAKSASVPRARVVTSSSIWNTLRTTVTLMNRPDLYPIIDGRNLNECNEKLICRRKRA